MLSSGRLLLVLFPMCNKLPDSSPGPDHSNVGCAQWQMFRLTSITINAQNLNLDIQVAVDS